MNPINHLKLIKENPGVYNFISDEQLAELLLQLLETKRLFKKAKVEVKNGVDGKDGYTPQAGVDYLSREQQEQLINELVATIDAPTGEAGQDGLDGADAEITDEDIQFIVDTVYDAVFPFIPGELSSEDIRNRLEVLTGDDRLSKDAIAGISELEEAIEELRNRPQGSGGGGLGRRQVNDLINTAISALDTDSTPTFEKVNKNLSSYPATLNFTGENLTSVVYTTDGGTITKTLSYTGDNLTSVVLSGDLPVGLSETTKTLTYSGDTLTGFSYS